MARYRKKPVVVEAMEWTGDINALLRFEGWYDHDDYDSPFVHHPDGTLTIETLEGEMTVSHGDYIIRGIAGEFYPCKPDIFAQTYEPVEDRDG